MKPILLIGLLLFSSQHSFAQSSGIKKKHELVAQLETLVLVIVQGRVLDADTKEGLANATVILKGGISSTKTDSLGHFTLSNIPASKSELIFTRIGYVSQVQLVSVSPLMPDIKLVKCKVYNCSGLDVK